MTAQEILDRLGIADFSKFQKDLMAAPLPSKASDISICINAKFELNKLTVTNEGRITDRLKLAVLACILLEIDEMKVAVTKIILDNRPEDMEAREDLSIFEELKNKASGFYIELKYTLETTTRTPSFDGSDDQTSYETLLQLIISLTQTIAGRTNEISTQAFDCFRSIVATTLFERFGALNHEEQEKLKRDPRSQRFFESLPQLKDTPAPEPELREASPASLTLSQVAQ